MAAAEQDTMTQSEPPSGRDSRGAFTLEQSVRTFRQCLPCGLDLDLLLVSCRQFVDQYAHEEPPFGFNGLGELVYRRTYSRAKPDGSREQWFETVARVSIEAHGS